MKPKAKEEESKWIQSPMPGRIVSVAVKEGDQVQYNSKESDRFVCVDLLLVLL